MHVVSCIVSKIIFALENIQFKFNVYGLKKINVYYNFFKKESLEPARWFSGQRCLIPCPVARVQSP